ncbi:MAG TPA: carbon-nitrogen hydrolase family protein [Candidatus Limnocylindrales bacterium]
MEPFRVALVQLDAGPDVEANLERARGLVERALAAGPELVALPETFLYRGPAAGLRASAAPIPGPRTEPFAELARDAGAWLLLGSLAERSPDPDRPYLTSVLLAPDGSISATYRKVHLFDIAVSDGPSARESARATPGEAVSVATLERSGGRGTVRLGLSICYDVRFPELYRSLALAGAEILTVPADFTERTGRDHWEVLLRARAIENAAFVIAPAQTGSGGGATIPAFGRSLVVDPWGTVLAQAPDGPGVVVADLDLDRVAAVRAQIPALANRRPDAYRL